MTFIRLTNVFLIYFSCPNKSTNYIDMSTSRVNLYDLPTKWLLYRMWNVHDNIQIISMSHEPLLWSTIYTGSTFKFRIYYICTMYNVNWLSRFYWVFCNVWNTKWNCFMKHEVYLCFLITSKKCSNSFSIKHNLRRI